MRRLFAAVLAVVLGIGMGSSSAQAEFVKGDIAIISMRSDNPDAIRFVALREILVGEEIKFTDNGWRSSGGFRANEGTSIWKADQNYSVGSNIEFTGLGGLSSSGDQVIAYTGEQSNPNLLFAVHSNGPTWNSNASDSNSSAQPTGLEGFSVAVSEVDNLWYTGTTEGTRGELLAAITDSSNWAGSNSSSSYSPITADFSVTSVPEPTSLLMLGSVMLAGICYRKR